jgi:hypothetical protein
MHNLDLGYLEGLAAEILAVLGTVESTPIIHESGMTMKELGEKRVVSVIGHGIGGKVIPAKMA